jgi:hypothetical protein
MYHVLLTLEALGISHKRDIRIKNLPSRSIIPVVVLVVDFSVLALSLAFHVSAGDGGNQTLDVVKAKGHVGKVSVFVFVFVFLLQVLRFVTSTAFSNLKKRSFLTPYITRRSLLRATDDATKPGIANRECQNCVRGASVAPITSAIGSRFV